MADDPKKKSDDAKPTPPASKSKAPAEPTGQESFKNLLANSEAMKLPDYSKIVTLSAIPDYASILGQYKIPDYASILGQYKIPDINLSTIDTSFLNSYRTFGDQLLDLRKRVEDQTKALRDEKSGATAKEKKIAKLEGTLEELRAKERIGFLLTRVNLHAQRQLLASEDFRRTFLESKECVAFVLAVDIRRSTELMLKARNPEAFAAFITTLCADLMNIVTEHYGVFDKFTGDGILAFFPDFYTGPDAAYYAVAAADKCHASFREHYQRFRRSFSSVLTGTGLGIGLDYGSVHLVQMAGGLTVVGAPVVYACRLSAAPPGITLVNQPAYEVVSDLFGPNCFIDETTVEIKHEGGMLAYHVRLNGREHTPKVPKWRQSSEASADG